MKKIFTILAFCMVGSLVFGQLPSNSKVPNFIGTDLNDNTIELYALLDQNKVVIVDVFAAWCGPCWSYHQTHVLEDLWQQYGDPGTGEIFVLGVESEGQNTTAQIYGPEGGTGALYTYGDWTAGITYPFIDDRAIGVDILGITYYPTLFIIYPNRIIFEIGQQSKAVFEAAIAASPGLAADTRDVSVLAYTGDEIQGCMEESSLSVNIQNMGTEVLTAADISVMMGGNEISTTSWTGSLQTYDVASVNLGSYSASSTSDLTIEVATTGGETNSDNNTTEFTLITRQTNNTITLNVHTDKWPEEMSWEFKNDDTGVVLARHSDLGTLQCETDYEQTVVVDATGCYSFNISDAYGDGILNGAINAGSHSCTNGATGTTAGAISISSTLAGVIFDDIDYGTGTNVSFEVSEVSGVEDITGLESLTVFPNPATDMINVDFTITDQENIEVIVMDILGQVVDRIQPTSYNAGKNMISIDVNNYPTGAYTVSLQTKNGVNSKRIVVE